MTTQTELTEGQILVGPQLQPPVQNPARLPWHEVRKVDSYSLPVDRLDGAREP
jgi:hypothetical protein